MKVWVLILILAAIGAAAGESIELLRRKPKSECEARGGTFYCQRSCICLAKGTVLP